jgi:hypothetical protein
MKLLGKKKLKKNDEATEALTLESTPQVTSSKKKKFRVLRQPGWD